ncbi:MAG: SpoVR family protein [Firmicutes bacterium]|nr:SpoVR family protein [Bacillota bacterium]
MDDRELAQLLEAIETIHEHARRMGLDGFPMRYEICPADVLYTFGAYGMPARFSHWSFGKAFYRMKTEYDYNLSRIYELVINSDPCYAFLLEGNSLLQNKVIVAHVLAHSDFFKHNYRFAQTSRNMVETMSAHAARIRRYEMRYGRESVEALLDAALALQEQVDPHQALRRAPPVEPDEASKAPLRPSTPYDDLWELDELSTQARGEQTRVDGSNSRPGEGCRDLLLFLAEHARGLAEWQRDVLTIVREEMLYFWPQMETKVLNEGWATYWHARLMREMELTEEEAVEFARLHASVLARSRTHVNPYDLGYHILLDIEQRFGASGPGMSQPGDAAWQKLFEIRETETDLSLVRNYLTRELVEKLDLFVYRRDGDEWVVTDKDWHRVRDELVQQMTNCGVPVIVVADGDWRGSGELYLEHRYEGIQLDRVYAERTLPYVFRIWGRPVHLETVLDGKRAVLTCDGGRVVWK